MSKDINNGLFISSKHDMHHMGVTAGIRLHGCTAFAFLFYFILFIFISIKNMQFVMQKVISLYADQKFTIGSFLK